MSPVPSFTSARLGDARPGAATDHGSLREAARLVRVKHGLTSSQLVLLGPGDAAPLLFARVARRWASRPTGRGRGVLGVPPLAGLAVSVVALLAAGWWVMQRLDLSAGAVVLGCVLSLLCIGMTAAALATKWAEPVHGGGFDAIVRRELTEGRWALVLHRMPPDRQVGVARLVRNGSQRWCMNRHPPRASRH